MVLPLPEINCGSPPKSLPTLAFLLVFVDPNFFTFTLNGVVTKIYSLMQRTEGNEQIIMNEKGKSIVVSSLDLLTPKYLLASLG